MTRIGKPVKPRPTAPSDWMGESVITLGIVEVACLAACEMQVLVSRAHSDNRVQKGQTHLGGHPAVSTEVRPAARFGDRRRDGRCACKGARALCSLDRNRGGHHLQTDTLREWQACRHVPVPCVRLFPTSSTRSETKAAGVGNYAISVSGDTGTSFAELSRSDKRRALAANLLIAQSSQNDKPAA